MRRCILEIFANATLGELCGCEMPRKGPKTFDQIIQKFLAQNSKNNMFFAGKRFYRMHIFCCGIDELMFLFQDLFPLFLDRDDMPSSLSVSGTYTPFSGILQARNFSQVEFINIFRCHEFSISEKFSWLSR